MQNFYLFICLLIGSTLSSPIHVAAAQGNLIKIQELLEAGAVIDEPFQITNPEKLPDCQGCKFNVNVDQGATALMFAIKNGFYEVALYLLEKGASAEISRADGWTPLHYVANYGAFKVLEVILTKNPPIDPLMPAVKATPLHFAAFKGHGDIISLLLERGANPNLKKAGGLTPLYESSDRGDLDSVKKMLKHGGDPTILSNDQVSPVRIDIYSPQFHIAVIKGNYAIVKLFLEEAKVNVNLPRNDDAVPLHDAAVFGHTQVLKLLLDHGAISKINTATADGITPLQAAVWDGRLEAVKLLVSYGANFDEFIFRYVRDAEVNTYFQVLFNAPPSRWGSDQWVAYVALFTTKKVPPISRTDLLASLRSHTITSQEECVKWLSSILGSLNEEKAKEFIKEVDSYLTTQQTTRADIVDQLHHESIFQRLLSWIL